MRAVLSRPLVFSLLSLAAATALAPPSGAQQVAFKGPTWNPPPPWSDVLSVVPGQINDLNRDASGRVVYCTKEGEVGAVDPLANRSARHTVLWSGPFGFALRAVAVDLSGNLVIVDWSGNLFEVPANGGAPVAVYTDLWMILDATDLVVDTTGDFFIASSTPSNGQRGVNRISADGSKWDYHIVKHGPVQIVPDPLSDDLLMADEDGGGKLRAIDGSCSTHPITVLDDTTGFGLDSSNDDGDMVCAGWTGNVFMIAGGDVWLHERATGTTSLFASGFAQLRGVTIAASTAGSGSATDWSLYVAEGREPTTIREIPGVEAPAELLAADLGEVPGRGNQLLYTEPLALQTVALAADNDGNLLLGGHQWQSNHKIIRYDTTTGATSTVAHQSDGLTGQIHGLVVAPDDTIYALTRQGTIHAITENPLVVSTVYSDLGNKITYGCSLARDVDGTFYVADRDGWGLGELIEISGGVATTLTSASEARGISADPVGGGLYLTEWNGPGFDGTVSRYDFGTDTLTLLPGFDLINYSNGNYDGDTVVDVNGHIYSCSEDDWSVVRYEPNKSGFTRLTSGYTRPLSGVELAPSTPGSGSTTGWSLYITDYDNLFEVPSVAGPASDVVDSGGARLAQWRATLDPTLGAPRSLTSASRKVEAMANGMYVATSRSIVVHANPVTGESERFAGPEVGLYGDLVAIGSGRAFGRGSGRLAVANRGGAVFTLDPSRPGAQANVVLQPGDPRLTGSVAGLLVGPRGRLVVETSGAGAGLFLVDRGRVRRFPDHIDPVVFARLRGPDRYVLDGWSILEIGAGAIAPPDSRTIPRPGSRTARAKSR